MEAAMPNAQLPRGANHEHLKNQAKTLLESFRSGDSDATARVASYFKDPTDVGIIQAQLVIAREYGFESWRKLLLEVARLRDDSGQLVSAGASAEYELTLDGSPLQCECVVRSNHNVATFIKELVLTLPDGVVLADVPDSVRVQIPPYEMHYSDIDVDEQYRADWLKYDVFTHRSVSKEPLSRTYHLANFPDENAILKCAIRIASPPPGSTHPAGKASSYLFNLKPGDKVTVAGLFGSSPVKDTQAEKVFVGGGAAMGPMRAYISDQLIHAKTTRKMSYWYGARNSQELFFADDFDRLEKEYANFSWHVGFSDAAQKRGNGHHGFVHDVLNDQFLKQHHEPDQCEYYIGGPPPMVDAAIDILQNAGVGSDNIYTIDFRPSEKVA
jgi:Na+-transporting NADH:ubiquinone oxidoreductase subunit F